MRIVSKLLLVSILSLHTACMPSPKAAHADSVGNTVSNENRGLGGMGTGTGTDYSNGPREDMDTRKSSVMINSKNLESEPSTRKPATQINRDARDSTLLKE